MPSDHECVAIAQTIFYVPIMPVTVYLVVRNWLIGPVMSRVSWLTLSVLSFMRFTGGILVITRGSDPYNLGLTIATVVLLNVGLIPLIMSTIGMIGIVVSSSVEIHNSFSKLMIIVRLLFIAALSLLVAGGAISLNGNSIGDNLVKAAYIIFTAILSAIIAMILHLRFQKSKLVPKSLIYLLGATIAIPFLILRIVYAVLSAFLSPDTWSPLVGSAVAFALMALLPEYITIVIYVYLGFHRIREHALCTGEATGDSGDQSHPHTQVIDMVQEVDDQDKKS